MMVLRQNQDKCTGGPLNMDKSGLWTIYLDFIYLLKWSHLADDLDSLRGKLAVVIQTPNILMIRGVCHL